MKYRAWGAGKNPTTLVFGRGEQQSRPPNNSVLLEFPTSSGSAHRSPAARLLFSLQASAVSLRLPGGGGGKGGILGLDRDLQPKMKGLPLARKRVPVICHQIPTYGGWVTLGCCLSQHCLKDVKLLRQAWEGLCGSQQLVSVGR